MPRKPGKSTAIPLFDPNTGRKYDRSKWRYNEVTKRMERLSTAERERIVPLPPAPEVPKCPSCVRKGRKPVHKVRTDAFGNPLGECAACLTGDDPAALGGRAAEGLRNMPSMVDR